MTEKMDGALGRCRPRQMYGDLLDIWRAYNHEKRGKIV